MIAAAELGRPAPAFEASGRNMDRAGHRATTLDMTDDPPDLLTRREAARLLRCCERTVSRLVDAGFPAIRIGGRWLIPRSAIERRVAGALAREPVAASTEPAPAEPVAAPELEPAELEPAETIDPRNLDPRTR